MSNIQNKPSGKKDANQPKTELSPVVPFPNLFQKKNIGGLTLANRIIGSPYFSGLANVDGSVSLRVIEHYRNLARGGTGLLLTENVFIDDDASKGNYCQLGISDPEFISGLAWLVSTIKEYDGAAGIVLDHCGNQKLLGKGFMKSASAVPSAIIHKRLGKQGVPKPLLVSEIEDIIESFGKAAEKAIKAGFDVIVIQAGNGTLISNFLSPLTNLRDDRFGGSLGNRARLLYAVVEKVKKNAGSNVPIVVRLNGSDYEEKGLKIDETVAISLELEKKEIDALFITGGNFQQINYQIGPMSVEHGLHVWAAEKIKSEVKIPVIVSGTINEPAQADDIIGAGKADFVAIGRSLWADPEWADKARRGKAEDIIPCIRCNDGCLERSLFGYRSITCSVNPTTGNELNALRTWPAKKRNILIIGGGPAGITAGLLNARKGHKVTLYEKRTLGGHLNDYSGYKYKADLKSLRDYYVGQVSNEPNIKVINKQATVDSIDDHKFDAVIIAIGGKHRKMDIPGMNYPHVYDAPAVWNNNLKFGNNIIIIGGNAASVDTALKCHDKDHRVTLINTLAVFMEDSPITDNIAYQDLLRQQGIEIISGYQVERVEKNQVIIKKGDEEKALEAETIIICIGKEPRREFAKQVRQETHLEIFEIGDCISPGRLHDAIHSAYRVVLRI